LDPELTIFNLNKNAKSLKKEMKQKI